MRVPSIRKQGAVLAAVSVVAAIALSVPAAPGQAARARTIHGDISGTYQVAKLLNIPYTTIPPDATHPGVTIKTDIFMPTGPHTNGYWPGLVLVHGGGWTVDSKDSDSGMAVAFASAGMVVYSIDFRQSCDPANPDPTIDDPALCGYEFPTNIQDVQTAMSWVRQNGTRYKTDPTRVGLLGHSSGGQIAAMAALTGTPGDSMPNALVTWSGPSDLPNDSGGADAGRVQSYFGCVIETCPDLLADASPLFHVAPGDPPVFVMDATLDHRNPAAEEFWPIYHAYLNAGVQATPYVVVGDCHALDCRSDDPNMQPATIEWIHQHLDGPLVSLDTGPTDQFNQPTATFTFWANDPNDTFTCSLDGATGVPCTSPYTVPVQPGPHTFVVTGQDGAQPPVSAIPWTWTMTPVNVSVLDGSYSPNSPLSAEGGLVNFTNNGTVPHTVTDSSGMGLFDSGSIAPGGTWSYQFTAAGVYAYQSTVGSAQTGSVKVAIVTSPVQAGSCTVTWAAATAPAGFGYDVQYQTPGSSTWNTWQNAVTVPQASFSAASGSGTYTFRGRIRKLSNNKSATYSPTATCKF